LHEVERGRCDDPRIILKRGEVGDVINVPPDASARIVVSVSICGLCFRLRGRLTFRRPFCACARAGRHASHCSSLFQEPPPTRSIGVHDFLRDPEFRLGFALAQVFAQHNPVVSSKNVSVSTGRILGHCLRPRCDEPHRAVPMSRPKKIQTETVPILAFALPAAGKRRRENADGVRGVARSRAGHHSHRRHHLVAYAAGAKSLNCRGVHRPFRVKAPCPISMPS
jgi:hypothetical protein